MYELIIAWAIADITHDTSVPEKISMLRQSALTLLRKQLFHYRLDSYDEKLLSAIAEKKCKMILQATTKGDLEKILKPSQPHYNGNRFIEDPYSVPEEELIIWSMTSLKAPLNEAGYKRFRELFHQVYPDIII